MKIGEAAVSVESDSPPKILKYSSKDKNAKQKKKNNNNKKQNKTKKEIPLGELSYILLFLFLYHHTVH